MFFVTIILLVKKARILGYGHGGMRWHGGMVAWAAWAHFRHGQPGRSGHLGHLGHIQRGTFYKILYNFIHKEKYPSIWLEAITVLMRQIA